VSDAGLYVSIIIRPGVNSARCVGGQVTRMSGKVCGRSGD
jgi:hypothetical protein